MVRGIEPAFPLCCYDPNGNIAYVRNDVTIYDFYVAAAITGLAGKDGVHDPQSLAERAHDIAIQALQIRELALEEEEKERNR